MLCQSMVKSLKRHFLMRRIAAALTVGDTITEIADSKFFYTVKDPVRRWGQASQVAPCLVLVDAVPPQRPPLRHPQISCISSFEATFNHWEAKKWVKPVAALGQISTFAFAGTLLHIVSSLDAKSR